MYAITAIVFMLFGYFILDLSFFTQTNALLLIFILFGWGLCQVSFSFFFQTFIQKAKTASSIITYSHNKYKNSNKIIFII
jgi:predicted Zn-dependent peptidase